MIKHIILASIVISSLSFPLSASEKPNIADSLGSTIHSYRDWEVRQKIDPMTDELVCTINNIAKPYVQASPERIMISFQGKGGISGYKLRVDQEPVTPLMLPSKLEKDLSTVIIVGPLVDRLLSSERLRVQTTPILRSQGLQFEDISLHGLLSSILFYQEHCP